MDNERGKGDHLHLLDTELKINFRNIEELLSVFRALVGLVRSQSPTFDQDFERFMKDYIAQLEVEVAKSEKPVPGGAQIIDLLPGARALFGWGNK